VSRTPAMPAKTGSLVLLALAPAAVVAWSPETFPAGRLVLALLAASAALVVVARPGARPDGISGAALLLLPPAVAAIAAAPGRARALDEAALFAALVLFALVGWMAADDPRVARSVTAVLAAVGTAASLLALAQAFWIYPATAAGMRAAGAPIDGFADAMLVRLEAGRPSGPFILPAALAGFLAMSLVATLRFVRRDRARGVRAAAAAALAAQVAALMLTRSLAGMIAAAVATGVVWVPRARRRTLAVAALAMAATLAAAVFLFDRRAEIAGGPGQDPLTLRAGNWRAAAAMIRDHPVAGVGPGGFATAYTAYLGAGMNETRFAHSSWLQIPACWGAWTLLPLAALALAWRRSLAAAIAAGDAAAALAAGGTAFLAHNFVDFTLYLPAVSVTGACAVGLTLGAARARRPEAGESAQSPISAVRRAGGTLAAVALALSLAAHGLASARAAGRLERARDLADAGRRDESLASARAAAAVRPGDPDPRGFLADLILAHGMDDPALRREGEEAAEMAVALDRRSAARHMTRAAYHAAAGEIAAARLELARAHLLYPAKAEYAVQATGVAR
jgi:O-antigen ligase